MQLVTFLVPTPCNGVVMRPMSMAVLYNSAAQQLVNAQAPVRLENLHVPRELDKPQVESCCVLAAGGLGDRIQATPALRELAKRVKGGKLDVFCQTPYPEWEGLPYLGHLSPNLAPAWVFDAYEAVLTWEGVIEAPEFNELALQDLFAWWHGVALTDDRPDYRFQPWEKRLNPLRGLRGRKRVVLHLGCNGPARTWPVTSWLDLATRLRKDFDVILVGSGHEAPSWEANFGQQRYMLPPPDGVYDLCGALPDIRHLAAVIRDAHLFVGVDSGPLHLAGAVGTRCVGLYGPFPYHLRGANLPVRPMQVLPPEDRCPCYTHARKGEKLPCERETCAMMSALTVERVEQTVREELSDA